MSKPKGMVMNPLIASLLRPEAYPHPTAAIKLRETHSAWVLLTGPYAYKLRKPVNFGFLDFSTPAKRRWFAREELRLNRRLSPDLYIDLVPVQGIELAVRMRQFNEDNLLPAVLERGALSTNAVEALAEELAIFHSEAAVAREEDGFGTAPVIQEPVLENLKALAGVEELRASLESLSAWLEQTFAELQPFFAERLASGCIRECHGDLHLGNMHLEGDRIRVFDCLEFNPSLRWIDTISEMAFLVMDLQVREQQPLAMRALNSWLDHSGNWSGLVGWRWYSVYRALVRAKVAQLRYLQHPEQKEAAEERNRYVEHAIDCSQAQAQALLITHGLSGSGKSWLCRQIAAELPALQLRSDVERKRLFGLWGEPRQKSMEGELYSRQSSAMLFERTLPRQAEAVLRGGFTPLVDACFLRRSERQRMAALAKQQGVPLVILKLETPLPLIKARIETRQRQGLDPSDATWEVVLQQRQWCEPISAMERSEAAVLELLEPIDAAAALERIRALIRWQAQQS